jgi:hypothetical protein
MRTEFMQNCLNFEGCFLEKVLWFDIPKQVQAKIGSPCWLLRQARFFVAGHQSGIVKFRKPYSEYYDSDDEQPSPITLYCSQSNDITSRL